jgi:4-carboxymuconolactone decarboxylase
VNESPQEKRQRALARMEEVYSMPFGDGEGEFWRYTADHLFADVWSRDGLSDRDRRLMLIAMLTATAGQDVLTIQVPAALASGDLDAATLREMVVFLAHYAGWPAAARLNSIVETEIAKAGKGSRDG